jgi:hypothetical protein
MTEEEYSDTDFETDSDADEEHTYSDTDFETDSTTDEDMILLQTSKNIDEYLTSINNSRKPSKVSPSSKPKTISQIRAECKEKGLVYDVDTKKCRPSKRAPKAPKESPPPPPPSPKDKPKTITQIRAECKEKGLVYDVDTKKCGPSKRASNILQVESKTEDCIDLSILGNTASIKRKYAERPGPPYSASDCRGDIKKGNDGKQYISTENKAGVWSWRIYKGEIQAVSSSPGIPSQFIEVAEDCAKIKAWKKGKILGHGTYGSIYVACKVNIPKNCDYVLKVQKDDIDFRWEVNALNDLKDVDFVVKMYAAWTCEGMGYIILEKLKKCPLSYDKVVELTDKLYNIDWLHSDSHSGNFMCREDGTLVAIDFGWAVKKGKKSYPKHIWSIQLDYDLTFDDIKLLQDRLIAREFLPHDNPKVVKFQNEYTKLRKYIDDQV